MVGLRAGCADRSAVTSGSSDCGGRLAVRREPPSEPQTPGTQMTALTEQEPNVHVVLVAL